MHKNINYLHYQPTTNLQIDKTDASNEVLAYVQKDCLDIDKELGINGVKYESCH